MKDGTHTYQTHGVCARTITFTAKDGKIYDIQFNGGCNGNLKMISKLLDGMTAEEINAKCAGNICRILDFLSASLIRSSKRSILTAIR